MALGGAVCGSLLGILSGGLGGAIYGMFVNNLGLGLDGALFGGGILALVGAIFGAALDPPGKPDDSRGQPTLPPARPFNSLTESGIANKGGR
jgi:hypothetical protein